MAPSDAVPAVEEGLPVVAILRFANDGDPQSEPVVDGFTEDVMGGLARFRTITVLARNSSFAFASDAAADWPAIGRQLRAAYLVRGRVGISAGSLEARVSLIDAANGSVMWSEVFVASGEAIFELQQDIALKIVNRLVSRLDHVTMARSAAKPPANLAAYELLQRGLMRLRGYREGDNFAAKALFEQALARDADYALAHSYVALADLIIGGFGGASPEVMSSVVERAYLAVNLAPEEPRCHRVFGQAQLFARRHEAAEYHLRRAYNLDPFDADTIAQMGFVLALRGRPVEALAWLDRAVRVNPIHPDWYNSDRGIALYVAGDYAEALASLSKVPNRTPWGMTRIAACHAQLGHNDEARRLMAEVRRVAPEFLPMEIAYHSVTNTLPTPSMSWKASKRRLLLKARKYRAGPLAAAGQHAHLT